MKINHSAIRSTIKIIALTAFIASIIWRLADLMRYGGTLDKDVKRKSSDDNLSNAATPVDAYDGDDDDDDDYADTDEEVIESGN